jgi:hypothetical protein
MAMSAPMVANGEIQKTDKLDEVVVSGLGVQTETFGSCSRRYD